MIPEQWRRRRSRERAGLRAARVLEKPGARFSSHGTSRETRRLAPEILSLKETTEGESGADV